MAEVEAFVVRLTVNQLRAVHEALGKMSGDKYSSWHLAEAGSEAYNRLTPFADEENWS